MINSFYASNGPRDKINDPYIILSLTYNLFLDMSDRVSCELNSDEQPVFFLFQSGRERQDGRGAEMLREVFRNDSVSRGGSQLDRVREVEAS